MNENAEIIELKVSSNEVKRAIDADEAELNGEVYHMLLMLDENDEPTGSFMVEKELERNGEIVLVPVTGEKEYNEASDMFMARLGTSAIDCMVDDNGILELEDEDGNPQRFELVDSVEYKDAIYHAVIPEGDDESFVILKQIVVDGGIALGSVDDDDEYDEIGEFFLRRFSESLDEDE